MNEPNLPELIVLLMKSPAPSDIWRTVARGAGPVLATAIHDGHGLRPEVANAMALGNHDRLREEGPFTGQAILGVPFIARRAAREELGV